MTSAKGWRARIRVHRPVPRAADRMIAALAPEAEREVPRTRTTIVRLTPTDLEVQIEASDTSACRAALNTYLAWIGLVSSTERAGQSLAEPGASAAAAKRLS